MTADRLLQDDRVRRAGTTGPADRTGLDARDRPASRDDLQRRLDQLPPGHPSSPYASDGTRRDSPARLPDLADEPGSAVDQTRPLTDAEWAEHRVEVRTRLEKAQSDGLASSQQHTIDGKGQIWTVERTALHERVIGDLLAGSARVPCDRKAIIAGGLGGAGKTTVLGDHAGIDTSQYLTINPDKIKEELARRGAVPHVDGLSPMEASGLVHEEASHIAKQLALKAQAEGRNIIWDITMSKRESADQRIDELRANGYDRVQGIFVDIPVDLSIERADARHRQDHEKYRAGDGLGGRLVPREVTRAQADQDWGSRNRRSFEELKQRFDSWSVYDNSVKDRDPLLVESSAEAGSRRDGTSR